MKGRKRGRHERSAGRGFEGNGAALLPSAEGPLDFWEGRGEEALSWPVSPDVAFRVGKAMAELSGARRSVVQGLSRDLAELCGRPEERFLFESVGLFALYIGDLPASERFHHRERFGLLDHSLEVAGGMLYEMNEGRAQARTSGHPTSPDEILWARGAMGMGLYHDLGKVFDLEVEDPGSDLEWNPSREPLAFFKRRVGIPFLAPTPLLYRKGRGLERHEERGLALVARLVPVLEEDPLVDFLAQGLRAYVERRWNPPKGPLQYLTALVSAMDVGSGEANYWARVRPGGSRKKGKRRREGS
jgi:hypothetical protein